MGDGRMGVIEFFPDEEWLELGADPRFLVSTRGRLYSLHGRLLVTPRIQGTGGNPEGRRPSWRITTQTRGRIIVMCARAVLITFVGPPRAGQVAHMKDGDRWNLALSNLVWSTGRLSVERARALSQAGNAAQRRAL
jgi:hypothetical protein